MNSDIQSLAAILVVIAAVGYLARRWWKNRHRTSQGCGGAEECACPSTKISGKPTS